MGKSKFPGPTGPMSCKQGGSKMSHRRLLGHRLALHVRLRQSLALGIVLAALFAQEILELNELNTVALAICAVVITGYNLVIYGIARTHTVHANDFAYQHRYAKTLFVAALLDFVALGACIWFVGGVRSPFIAIYILHVILGCIVHSRKSAMWLAAFAYLSIATLALLEYGLGLQPSLPLGAIYAAHTLDGRYVLTILVIWALLLGTTTFLLLSVIRELRWRERLLHSTMHDLERLSEFRRDFLHIALHNLRSPIGVSTAHLQNLLRGYGGPLTMEQKSWIERCVARLRGLSDFLRDLRMLSVMDSCEALTDEEQLGIDVRDLLCNLEREYQDLAEMHAHRLVLDLSEELPRVRAVPRLLQEALANYVTNAIKYTPRGGRIVLRARSEGDKVFAEVEDNGIGIAESQMDKLFDDFVRLEIDESQVSDATGSGLGLSIVRRVSECFRGRVYVESEVGKGSTFGLELPALEKRPG